MKTLIALAVVTLAWSTPGVPQQPSIIPADTIARAKFPNDDPAKVDALAFINATVNAAIEPMSDKDHYGVEELWVMAPADRKGDCDDFALTKLMMLSEAHFPTIANSKIVTVMVHLRNGRGGGHAILAVRLPSGSVLYMDNLFDQLMTRAELVARGYHFFDWVA